MWPAFVGECPPFNVLHMLVRFILTVLGCFFEDKTAITQILFEKTTHEKKTTRKTKKTTQMLFNILDHLPKILDMVVHISKRHRE